MTMPFLYAIRTGMTGLWLIQQDIKQLMQTTLQLLTSLSIVLDCQVNKRADARPAQKGALCVETLRVISPSFGAGLPLTILGGLESPENSRREAAGKGSDNGLPGWPRTAVLKDCAWNLDFSPYRAERGTAGFFSSSPGTNAFAGSRGEN